MRTEGLRANLFQLLMTRMDEVDRGDFSNLRVIRQGSAGNGKFSLEGTSPNQALKAKAEKIAAQQDLTVINEQQEETFARTKSHISQHGEDEDDYD